MKKIFLSLALAASVLFPNAALAVTAPTPEVNVIEQTASVDSAEDHVIIIIIIVAYY